MSTRSERESDSATKERHQNVLKELMARPENRICVDCKKRNPRWASHNLGVFFCIRCSGVHRSLGTHISKVKSADLDTWTAEQVVNMIKWGNARANTYWEQKLPKSHTVEDNSAAEFIKEKYQFKRYAADGPMPDPTGIATLEPLAPLGPLASQFLQSQGLDPLTQPSASNPYTNATSKPPVAASNNIIDDLLSLGSTGLVTDNSTAVTPSAQRTTKDDIMALFNA